MLRSTIGRVAAVALLLAAPLIALELGVRLLISTERLPVAAAHTPEFEITWENLSRLGTPDVLVLGDSVSQQGIEPAVLARLLGRETAEPLVVFNGASPGGGVGVSWAIAEQLAREDRLPRVAVVGIYPGTLRSDATYRNVFGLTPMGGLFSGCERMNDYGQHLDCGFGAFSAAWRWRGHLDRVVGALGDGVPFKITTDGLFLREDGFREGRGVPLSRLLEQLDAADLRIRIFEVSDDVADGYVRLIETLESHGVAVIPVAIPDTPQLIERMERMQPGRRDLFREALDDLETRTGIEFVDPVAFGAWWGDGQARNFNHLSAEGAVKFTRQLWSMENFRARLLGALSGQPG
jgi:hypothetical protein